MPETDFNQGIIDEFRANDGVVSRPYPDSTLLLVTLRGAKSGREMTLPLEFLELDGVAHVYATRGGGPRHPAWYFNLLANPDVTVEQGTQTYRARARELEGDERDRAWRALVDAKPRFAEYETKTDRVFPVFALDRLEEICVIAHRS
jgi:deazaflavin-dependent oxidoreductase (nitroreductase family)